MPDSARKLGALRWKPWALLGMAALAWWYYAAPINVVKRIRSSVQERPPSATSVLVSSRVDFARVNARLSGDLRRAVQGHLDGKSFSRLLLFGWLPQQRQYVGEAQDTSRAVENSPAPGSVSARARHTQLYQVRYKSANEFIAIFWDASQVHEIVLTLQRQGMLDRWYVTRVTQINVCAYDFDCAQVPVEGIRSAYHIEPPSKTGR